MYVRVEAARRHAGEVHLRSVLQAELDAGRLDEDVFADYVAQAEVTRQFLNLTASVHLGLAASPRAYQAPKAPAAPGASTFGVNADAVSKLIKTMSKKVDSINASAPRGGAGRPQSRGGRNGRQRQQQPQHRQQQQPPDWKKQKPEATFKEQPRAKKAADMGSKTGSGDGPGTGGGRGRSRHGQQGRGSGQGRGRRGR
jgi:hypothetical protein